MTATKLLHQKPKIQKGKMFPVISHLFIKVLFNNFQVTSKSVLTDSGKKGNNKKVRG